MITVIILTLNEEKTIGHVIDIVKTNPEVNEILVVDDKSKDKTVEIAQRHGAKVEVLRPNLRKTAVWTNLLIKS